MRSGYPATGSSGRVAGSPKSGSCSSTSRGPVSLIAVGPRSRGGRRPRSGAAARPVQDHELIGADPRPRPRRAVRPQDAHVGPARRTESNVDPAELAAGMPATDRQLTAHRRVTDPDLEPGTDRVAVRARLLRAEGEPAGGRCRGCVPYAEVPPDPRRRPQVDLDEVEQAVEVEVGEGRPASEVIAQDPGRVRALLERPVRLAEQEVARVAQGIVLLLPNVALRDEQVDEPAVVDVLELRVPRRRGQWVAADERAIGADAALEADVAVGRLARAAREGLEAVLTLARQEDLRKPVAGEVVAGDPHPLDVHAHPSLVGRVEARRGTGLHPPQLLLAVHVLVLVVADPEVAPAGAVPVREDH